MANMMAIVSKSVFEKERDSEGNPLVVGGVWDTDAYHSTNKSIMKNLAGDLYLITVRDGALLHVATLVAPKHNGKSWVAEKNDVAIRDITDIADALVFTSGKGVNTEKMAMSLQTPRVLIDEDVALLSSEDAPKPSNGKPTAKDKEDAVVHVLSAILERSADDIRNDKNRYAAFHWDDGFVDEQEGNLDWSTGKFEEEFPNEYWFWGRCDFDLSKTLVADESTHPDNMTDIAAREIAAKQGGLLYLPQLAQLISEERLELDFPMVIGRIKGGETLIEAAQALFGLSESAEDLDDEYYEVDPEWEEMISGIANTTVRHHIGVFFQESDIARCFGACFGSAGLVDELADQYVEVASWWSGEGQGELCLARILDDSVPTIPSFAGAELIEKIVETPMGGAKRVENGDESELQIETFSEHFKTWRSAWSSDSTLSNFAEALTEHDSKSLVRGMLIVQPYLQEILTPTVRIMQRGEYRFAYPIWDLALQVMDEQHSHYSLFNRGCALMMLYAFEGGRRDFENYLQLCEKFPYEQIPLSYAHTNSAICCLHLDDLESALNHAKQATELSPDLMNAVSILGRVQFAMGDVKAAMKNIEVAMKGGESVSGSRELAENEEFRALAIKYKVPVQLKW